jgi:hypothetical protein
MGDFSRYKSVGSGLLPHLIHGRPSEACSMMFVIAATDFVRFVFALGFAAGFKGNTSFGFCDFWLT